MIRRDFLRNAFWAALTPLSRPLSAKARTARSAAGPGPRFLTNSEYAYINRIAREVVPTEPVLSGQVDVAMNIDTFMAGTRAEDLSDMLRYLRLIRMAEPLAPVIRPFMPGIDRDIMSLKKVICFVGYYSDANGEADLDPAERMIWPSFGYPGPKPEDFFPEDAEPQIDPASLEDRIGRVL